MSIINNFTAYVKQIWENRPSTKSPVSAERLGHMEDGIKMNSDAMEKVAAAVLSTIVNDPDKIASMAALYAVNQTVTANAAAIAELNSNKVNYSDKTYGSYTGNGNEAERTIEIGGLTPTTRMLYIYCGNRGSHVLVTGAGSFYWENAGGMDTLSNNEVNYTSDGVLKIKSTSVYLNNNDYTYRWRVL